MWRCASIPTRQSPRALASGHLWLSHCAPVPRIAPGLLRAIILAFGVAAFALLGGMTLTGLLVFLFYELAPVTVMLALTILYGTPVLLLLHRRLAGLLRMETIFE